MNVSYNGLWKALIDKGMNKKDLGQAVGLSGSTIAKMSKGDFVSLEVLYRICKHLDIDFGDIISMNVNVEEKK